MKKVRSKDEGKVKIARAYIRVSHQGLRERGDGEFPSPDVQLDSSRAYAAAHLGDYAFDAEASVGHMDIDRSASRLKWTRREGLVEHLQAARRKEFDALICFKLSRFARNVRDGLELFKLFEEAGCSIHCVKDNIDTGTPHGRMITTILLAIAEMEAENISEWLVEAFLKRAEKGLAHGTTAFWISRNGDAEYELNDRSNEIRRLVDLCLEGKSHVEIARVLNREGARTRMGRLWNGEKVRRYLEPDRLKLMRGHYVYGVDLEDGDPRRITVENLFPPVITEEEAESLMSYNRRMAELYHTGNPRKAARTSYVLSGLVWCSQCDGKMQSRTSTTHGRSKSSYECRPAETNNVPHPVGTFVSADMLEDAMLRMVHEAVLDYQEALKAGPKPKPVDAAPGSGLAKCLAGIDGRVLRLI